MYSFSIKVKSVFCCISNISPEGEVNTTVNRIGAFTCNRIFSVIMYFLETFSDEILALTLSSFLPKQIVVEQHCVFYKYKNNWNILC